MRHLLTLPSRDRQGALVLRVLSLFLLALSVSAQQDFKISDNVNLVLLDVNVKDSKGAFVPDLQKSDFHVLEDGKPRSISQFGNSDSPVTIGLVVDHSASMHSKMGDVLEAGLAFAKQSNPNDEFFVVNFNNTVVPGLPRDTPFTDSLSVLQKALYYGTPMGQTALYDAISYSLNHLEQAHREQRTLIVVSDGGDNISKISLKDLLEKIELSRATIYTIGLVDPENRDLKPGILRKISSISGGAYFEPHTLRDMPGVFSQISKDIRQRYTIGFTPDEDHDKKTVRSVKVSAQHDGQHLSCRTRSTFRLPASAGGTI